MLKKHCKMDGDVEISEMEVHEETINDIDFEVLHPQNPLLIRFQSGLKQLLESKLNSINEDIRQAVSFTWFSCQLCITSRYGILILHWFILQSQSAVEKLSHRNGLCLLFLCRSLLN